MTKPDRNTLNNEAVISRVRYLMGVTHMSQVQLARRINIDPATLSKILSGKLPISEGFINRIVVDMGVSKRWLRDGDDIPFAKPLHAHTIDRPEATMTTDRRTSRGVPVYDIDVTAGFGPLELLFTNEVVIGMVDLPQLSSNCAIVRVCGDSMTPTVPSGAFIAVRDVTGTSSIFWGQIYVVVLDAYRMVKFLRRHPSDPGKVVLHSDNPAYDDMDVDISEIRRLYLVEAILNYDIRC